MSEEPRYLAASIQARLANRARSLHMPFGEILQYYGMERFLFRLSRTRYTDSFVLKGGLFFYVWDLPLDGQPEILISWGFKVVEKKIFAR